MTKNTSAIFETLDFLPCAEDDCDRPQRWGEFCATHANRRKNGLSPNISNESSFPRCSVSHCSRMANSRTDGAMCEAHYQAAYRGKDPEQKILPQEQPLCWVDSCQKPIRMKGLCATHHYQAKRGRIQVPGHLGVAMNPPCSFPDCGRTTESKGWCRTHGEQFRSGEEMKPLRPYGIYMEASPCAVPTCKKPVFSVQFCSGHASKMSRYSLSAEDLIALSMVAECENPGCQNTTRLHIDHDHSTGNVRGVLCSGCNTSLGSLQDSPNRILGLVQYLDSNRSSWAIPPIPAEPKRQDLPH